MYRVLSSADLIGNRFAFAAYPPFEPRSSGRISKPSVETEDPASEWKRLQEPHAISEPGTREKSCFSV